MSDPSHVDTRETPPEVRSEVPATQPLTSSAPPSAEPVASSAPPAAQPETESELHSVAYLVHEEFDEKLDPRAVEDTLSKVTARFDGAPVRVFVPLLVRRYAREELKSRLGEIR